MLQYLCNAFNDPSDPWYYVIGLLFLLLIFGALTAYVLLSGKKNKNGAESKDEQAETTNTTQTSDKTEPTVDTVSDSQEPSDK